MRAQLGVPFQEYRHRIRVMRFIERAGSNAHGWTRAASDAGFGSYSQCFRAFAHVTGFSPTRYWQSGKVALDNALADR
jgi:methylphosphotriester-DNA--protein-cysteine methyltransferase